MNRSSIFYWTRWILLLPLSIGVGFLVATVIGTILSYIISAQISGKYQQALSPLITSFSCVITARVVAPKNKSGAVMLICGLWLTVILMLLLITTAHLKFYSQEWEIKDNGVAITQMLCGLACGWYLSRKGEKAFTANITDAPKRDKALLTKIEGIEGLEAMTVNERLYVTGLMDEFYSVKLINKPRATQILRWLKVDEESINSILNG